MLRERKLLLAGISILYIYTGGNTKTQDVEAIKCTWGILKKERINLVAPADPIHISQSRKLPAQPNTQ